MVAGGWWLVVTGRGCLWLLLLLLLLLLLQHFFRCKLRAEFNHLLCNLFNSRHRTDAPLP